MNPVMTRRGATQLGELPEEVYPDNALPVPARQRPDIPQIALRVARQGNFYPVPFVANTISNEIVPADENRVYLFIQNHGVVSMFVNFGNEAGSPYLEILPAPNGYFEPLVAPTNSIHIVTLSGTAAGILLQAGSKTRGVL